MRTIIYFTRFFFVNIRTIPNIIRYNLLLKKGDRTVTREFLYKVTGQWAKKLYTNSGSTATVHNLDLLPEGNFLLVSNHQGNFDIPLLMTYIPRLMGFVAKKDLAKVPIISGWMKRMECVFLDRNNLRQSMRMLNEVATKLKEGQSFVLFPEGTRSQGPTMNEFKKGSLRIAVKAGIPIVPVTIDGSYRIFEDTKKIVPTHVNLTIHQPIETANMSKEDERELADKVYHIINSKLN